MTEFSSTGQASGGLSIDGHPVAPVVPPTAADVNVAGKFQAVIDVTGGNLHQIEVAVAANAHEVDPHPTNPGAFVSRHPIFLVGTPAELDLATIRSLYSKRFSYVSPDAPPEDGSHISI